MPFSLAKRQAWVALSVCVFLCGCHGLAHQQAKSLAQAPETQAKDHCFSLEKLTGLPFDLPTEAQWEFSTNEGGKLISQPMHHLPGYATSVGDQT